MTGFIYKGPNLFKPLMQGQTCIYFDKIWGFYVSQKMKKYNKIRYFQNKQMRKQVFFSPTYEVCIPIRYLHNMQYLPAVYCAAVAAGPEG